MVKGDFHISIEPYLYKEFMDIVGRGNTSRKIEDYIQNVVATHNKDISGINLKILEQEIQKLQTSLMRTKAELDNKLQLKEQIVNDKAEKEKQTLEAEKERIALLKTCKNCGRTDALKYHTFKIGPICNSCFQGADGDLMKKWNG